MSATSGNPSWLETPNVMLEGLTILYLGYPDRRWAVMLASPTEE